MLAVLLWLQTAITTSLRRRDEEIPVDPFTFGEAEYRDFSFALELKLGDARFEYLLDIGHQHVSYEALFHYPEGRSDEFSNAMGIDSFSNEN